MTLLMIFFSLPGLREHLLESSLPLRLSDLVCWSHGYRWDICFKSCGQTVPTNVFCCFKVSDLFWFGSPDSAYHIFLSLGLSHALYKRWGRSSHSRTSFAISNLFWNINQPWIKSYHYDLTFKITVQLNPPAPPTWSLRIESQSSSLPWNHESSEDWQQGQHLLLDSVARLILRKSVSPGPWFNVSIMPFMKLWPQLGPLRFRHDKNINCFACSIRYHYSKSLFLRLTRLIATENISSSHKFTHNHPEPKWEV